MPYLWNNVLVVTKEELVPAWYSSLDTLSKTITRYSEKDYGIKRVQIGGNGRQMLIAFDSLPTHMQTGIGDPRKCDHILERFYKVDGAAVSFYSTFRFEDQSTLAIEYQERYIINASVLKAILALRTARENDRKNKGGSIKGIAETLVSDAHSFQPTLLARHKVQHTLQENSRCFMDTLNKFEKEGYKALISGKHKNQNTRKVTDETLSLLKSLFAGRGSKPTATEVYQSYDAFIGGYIAVINNATGEYYQPSDFKKLSDATVKSYMASWASKIGTYAIRSGDRQKLMQQFKPYHSLLKPKYAGSIISIDDRQPPFKMPNGNRVWFYNGIDLGSEAYTCWVHGDTKEGIITEFYRQLVRNYAEWGFQLPAELEAESSLNSSFTDTFLREGAMFQHVRIEANNARGKRIERYFGSLRYGIEKKRDEWLARPFAQSESNQAGPKASPMLSYSQIVENGLTDIEQWNNEPHSVHTHMSRWQVFCEMQNPDLKPTNYAAILPHLGYKTKSSCRVGIIKLNYKEFLLGNDNKISLGDKLINLMKQVEGKEVDVYWLDDNQGKVFKALIFIGDQLICEAIAKPEYNRAKIEQTGTDEANRAIMSAYVATIESYGRRQKNAIDKVTIIDERPAAFSSFVMPGLKKNKTEERQPSGGILPDSFSDSYDNIQEESFVIPLSERF